MAESTLSLQYKHLLAEVGAFLGFGRGDLFGDRAWDTRQLNEIRGCIRSGLAQFYNPPAIDNLASPYDWSFLKPLATLDFAEGADVVLLPDDFGGIEGPLVLLSDGLSVGGPIRPLNGGQIRARYAQNPTITGRPECFGVEWNKGTGLYRGQRAQLILYPLAEEAFQLQFTYYIVPDALTDAAPNTYGGAQHSETILESCLSIAEQRLDDKPGVHTAKFHERLIASIGLDRRNKPQNLGENLDRSDDKNWGKIRNSSPVLYNGVRY